MQVGIAPGGAEWALIQGEALATLKGFTENSFDALVTDPPAGMDYQNREWDGDKGGRDKWIAWLQEIMVECYRVLKPGGHGLVWQMPRFSHWTAMACENAGFQVRDICHHLFKNGFPKNQNVEKAVKRSKKTTTIQVEKYTGAGTALKNASEHWILIRKPLDGTMAQNLAKWGTGPIAIDSSRVKTSKGDGWPRNVVVDDDCPEDVTRFFYVPKPSTKERDFGLEDLPVKGAGELTQRKDGALGLNSPRAGAGRKGNRRNSHPTVKSIDLMRYLIRMITPPGGLVLDPFAGSGTTLIASGIDNFNSVGIERETEYIEQAPLRIKAWLKGEI